MRTKRPAGRTVAAARRGGLELLLMLLLLASGAGCGKKPAQMKPPPAVTVVRPRMGPVTEYLDFTGTTAATESVTLVARVEGYLETVHFKDGAQVKKDDLLFTIQRDQYLAQLQQARSQVAAEKAALWHAKTELTRYTNLVRQDSAPQTQVDRWRYERDTAAAKLLAAQAQVELARLDLGYTRIRAPFDGRMGRHLVDPGNVVGAMGQETALARINRIDPLYVYFTINERDLLKIVKKREATTDQPLDKAPVEAAFALLDEQGYPHRGQLDFAGLSVTPTTGTLQLRGTFPNPDPPVLPGLFARVRVPVGTRHDALTVPAEALRFDQQGEYLLLVNKADVVERRAVHTGVRQGQRIVVIEGLTPTDRVVVEGLARAVPGRTVSPQPGGTIGAASPSADGSGS